MQRHDIDELIANPHRHFDKPYDVVAETDLSLSDKIKILESWKLDAQRLAESTAENMSGGEESDLRDVSKALGELKAQVQEMREPPRVVTRKASETRAPAPAKSKVRVGLGFIVGGVIGAGFGLMALAAGGWAAASFGGPLLLLLETTVIGSLLGGLTSAIRRKVQTH